jgi:hypothetical protein
MAWPKVGRVKRTGKDTACTSKKKIQFYIFATFNLGKILCNVDPFYGFTKYQDLIFLSLNL